MSMEGDSVLKNSLRRSYTPCDEFSKDLVPVGGTDQSGHGKAAADGVVGRQDVPKVSGGDADQNGSPFRTFRRRHVIVAREVVGDLRGQASPVDGVGGRKVKMKASQLPVEGESEKICLTPV